MSEFTTFPEPGDSNLPLLMSMPGILLPQDILNSCRPGFVLKVRFLVPSEITRIAECGTLNLPNYVDTCLL